jgi:hypothetical protein
VRHVRVPILAQLVALLRLEEISSDHHGARVHNALVRALGEKYVWLRFVVMAAIGFIVDSLVFMPALSIYEAYLVFLGKQFLFTLSEALQSRRMYEKLLRAYDSVTRQEHGNWSPSEELRASVDQRKVQVREQFLKSYRLSILFNVVLCFIGAWPCLAAGIYETFFPALLVMSNLANMVGLFKQLRAARRVEGLRRTTLSRLKTRAGTRKLSIMSTKVGSSSSNQVQPSNVHARSSDAQAASD